MKNMIQRTLIILLLLTVFAQPVYAAQSVTVVTNGGRTVYSTGYVMAVAGQVKNDGTAVKDTDVFIQISSSGTPVYYASTKTNSSGYYTTNFAIPSDFSDGSYTLTASTAQASVSSTFTVQPNAATNELSLIGSNPVGSESTPTTTIPVSTDTLVLVFNSNVNYFINKTALPGVIIGENENNEDCIKIYKGTSKTRVSFDVNLVDDLTAGAASTNYYNLTGAQASTTKQCCLILNFKESLAADTLYIVKISRNLCSNNGSKLGTDKIIYLKTTAATSTEATSAAGGGGGAGGVESAVSATDAVASLPTAVSASEIGKVVQSGNTATVQIDAKKASAILSDTAMSALVVNISDIAASGVQKAIELPAAVVDLAKTENKPIAIQNGGLIMLIPPEVLIQGKDMTFSTAQVSDQMVSSVPEQTENKAVYSFDAASDGTAVHSFKKAVTITLPIPEGVTNADKLGVYYFNEDSSSWEYMGGRIVNDQLVFTTRHFSKYMVAESTRTFVDIASHWAKNSIEVMLARNIINGVDADHFAPQRSITRAEFASLLSRVLKLTDGTGAESFTDVDTSKWYENDVGKAAKAGIILGSNQKFRPNDKITRQEMAVMVMRAYRYAGGTVNNEKELAFSDCSRINSWASSSVKEACSLGIIKGNPDGRFGALNSATRAEGTVMLRALMDLQGL